MSYLGNIPCRWLARGDSSPARGLYPPSHVPDGRFQACRRITSANGLRTVSARKSCVCRSSLCRVVPFGESLRWHHHRPCGLAMGRAGVLAMIVRGKHRGYGRLISWPVSDCHRLAAPTCHRLVVAARGVTSACASGPDGYTSDIICAPGRPGRRGPSWNEMSVDGRGELPPIVNTRVRFPGECLRL